MIWYSKNKPATQYRILHAAVDMNLTVWNLTMSLTCTHNRVCLWSSSAFFGHLWPEEYLHCLSPAFFYSDTDRNVVIYPWSLKYAAGGVAFHLLWNKLLDLFMNPHHIFICILIVLICLNFTWRFCHKKQVLITLIFQFYQYFIMTHILYWQDIVNYKGYCFCE